jgi:hypothetical protein
MSKIIRWLKNKWLSLKIGVPVSVANGGKPIDVLTIRYNDLYFFVDIDVESGEPTGGFGWSDDPTMNPTVPIRDILVAKPPQERITK